MTTETHHLTVNGLAVGVVRKPIKNLHLGVYPPDGRVRVAAPLAVSDEAVRLAVIDKLGWIKRQRAKFAAQERQSPREMVRGESHYFLGQRYRLRVFEHTGPERVIPRGRSFLDLYVPSGAPAAQREQVLQRWYRRELKALVPPLLENWQPALEVEISGWGIRRMKTKWGSCNADSGRIWLNLELAKKPVQCLEYVLVHELAHLRERRHCDRFTALLDSVMPPWRTYRQELNSAPLAHETWTY